MYFGSTETLEFDTTPINEDCTQVGVENYSELAKNEARRTIAILEKKLLGPNNEAFAAIQGYFTIGGCPHDFGTYYEIRYKFLEDEDCEVGDIQACAWDFANFVENNFPMTWDDDEPVNFADYMANKAKTQEVY